MPLDSDTFVCLASPIGKADAANVVAGLQIVRRQNGQWSMAPLEAEGNSRWWQGILWASRTEGGVEFVLKSRTRLSSGQWAWGVWVLCVADGRAQSAELLMAFSMRGHTPISSTRDGRHVFAVEGGLRLGKDEDILHVVARAPDGLTLRDEPIPMGTDTILVSPDGGKAFLACIGWLEDPSCILVRQEAARWRVEDLTESVRPNLSGAAWLSDSEVLLGYPRVGILRWNPETGAQEPFWSF